MSNNEDLQNQDPAPEGEGEQKEAQDQPNQEDSGSTHEGDTSKN